MGKMHDFMEKAIIAAVMAAMVGLGMVGLLLGATGVLLTAINKTPLLLGYFAFCIGIWLIFMFPYIKKL